MDDPTVLALVITALFWVLIIVARVIWALVAWVGYATSRPAVVEIEVAE